MGSGGVRWSLAWRERNARRCLTTQAGCATPATRSKPQGTLSHTQHPHIKYFEDEEHGNAPGAKVNLQLCHSANYHKDNELLVALGTVNTCQIKVLKKKHVEYIKHIALKAAESTDAPSCLQGSFIITP